MSGFAFGAQLGGQGPDDRVGLGPSGVGSRRRGPGLGLLTAEAFDAVAEVGVVVEEVDRDTAGSGD